MPRGRQRHDGVEADVVFAAKAPSVRQGTGRNQRFEFRARIDLVDKHGLQLVRLRWCGTASTSRSAGSYTPRPHQQQLHRKFTKTMESFRAMMSPAHETH